MVCPCRCIGHTCFAGISLYACVPACMLAWRCACVRLCARHFTFTSLQWLNLIFLGESIHSARWLRLAELNVLCTSIVPGRHLLTNHMALALVLVGAWHHRGIFACFHACPLACPHWPVHWPVSEGWTCVGTLHWNYWRHVWLARSSLATSCSRIICSGHLHRRMPNPFLQMEEANLWRAQDVCKRHKTGKHRNSIEIAWNSMK